MASSECNGDSAAVRITVEDGIARVAMTRPERKNAFAPEMIESLRAAFRAIGKRNDIRAVVLSGDGDVFSAGADLDWMRKAADYSFSENVADALRLADCLEALRECPKPVVARVQGAAMGGGAGLVAAADIAVVADDTVFAFSEVRLGLVPAVISRFVLPRIGEAAARELFLTGERFDAAHAHSIGLVARVVRAADLDTAVNQRLEALAAGGPAAQSAVKRLISRVAADPDGSREYTARMIAACRASEEGRDGMTAFLEGRRPAWALPRAPSSGAPPERSD